jgi:hypothetical protein
MKGIEKAILQASVSLYVDRILSLKKIITLYATAFAGQKRDGAVLYCTSSSSGKERSLLQPYIVTDNNQEHSNEELVMYSCLWGKAAVGSNLHQQSVKKSIEQ